MPIRPTPRIWSFESGLLKPNARMCTLACEELAVDVQHTLMVGDSRACDYEVATSVGIPAALVDRSGTRHFGIDCISSLKQLLPTIHATGKL
ncbi:HAD hydrolase-like protein [Pandoraea sp. PE-S2R-1]|uniref:HAD hydrolase-like protein n=1 Tax=Pandoraea sp. PE-S2R-1 TaxID=1986994 RepID=UPI00352B6B67